MFQVGFLKQNLQQCTPLWQKIYFLEEEEEEEENKGIENNFNTKLHSRPQIESRLIHDFKFELFQHLAK